MFPVSVRHPGCPKPIFSLEGPREGPFDFSRVAVVASLAQVIGGGPMKQIFQFLILAIAVSTTASTSAWAQSTAQITGTVKDASGAVLPGVEVTATQTETGIARSTVSNETGVYVLPNLPLGPYKLEAALAGFRTFIQTGIVLQVNSNPVINVTLEVGQRSEQVEVQANAALVETRTVGVGQTMETQRILELPLNGRNAAELVLTVGAAVSMPEYASSPRSMQNQLSIAVAGGLPNGTNSAAQRVVPSCVTSFFSSAAIRGRLTARTPPTFRTSSRRRRCCRAISARSDRRPATTASHGFFPQPWGSAATQRIASTLRCSIRSL